MAVAWGRPEERYLTGHDVPRVDGPDKVTGKAKYAYDINLPGMLYGKILRSPHPHATVKSVNLAKAKAHPGVKAVLDFEKKTVRYAGEEVAAVAAVSPDVAEEAIRLIEVEYERLPHVVDEEEAMKPEAPKIHQDGNVRPRKDDPQIRGGDPDPVFADPGTVWVEGTYRTQVQTHSCLETHGLVAKWEGDKLTVWTSTQGVFGVRDDLAKFFNVPAANVHAVCEVMGGGFGSKFGAGVEGTAAARLAKESGAPVKLMLSRHEEHLCVGNRPSSVQKIRIGATKEGKLVAFHSKVYGTGGIAGGAGVPLPYVYESIPNVKTEHTDVRINAGSSRAMRAPGHPQAAFGMCSAMDELAEKLGMDLLELCRRNESVQNAIRLKQYDIGAERIGWGGRNKVPGAGPGPKKRGIGLGFGKWGGGGGKGTFAEVVIHPDGTVESKCGVQDIGTGIRTVVGMIAAEELGLHLKDVKALVGDTVLPPGTASGGSRTSPSAAPAVKLAAVNAKEKLFEKLAPALGVTPDKLVAKDGKIGVAGDASKTLDWKSACAQIGSVPISGQSEWAEGLSGSGVAGVQFAEVEVDVETGAVRVVKVVAVQDCGLVLNRLTAISQVKGGVIQGISWALLEDRIMDRPTGLMVNPNLEDYKIAGTLEMPEFDVVLMDMPERGVIGLGEPPVIPTAGAVANAIYNAVGVRFRELPITPDRVLSALMRKIS